MQAPDDLRERVLSSLVGDQLVAFVESNGHRTKRSGGEYKLLCPFHNDGTPSMGLNVRKREGGIFKCFSCGWSGDVFDFFGEQHGVENFRDRLKLVAGMIGLHVEGPAVKRGAAPAKRETLKPEVSYMEPAEVVKAYEHYRNAALDPAPWAAKLKVDPRALQITGMFVAPYATSPDRIVLVAPQRTADGVMTSLRFRCFETKKRWSLDVKERRNGVFEQVKCSRAGLMSYPETFDSDVCLDGMKTLVIEGETDLLGAVTILLRSGETDPALWPVRVVALPGVTSIHDELLKLRPTKIWITFFDNDQAGIRAVFWHRQQKRIEKAEGGWINVDDLDKEPVPGLLQRMQDMKFIARAAFPPHNGTGKYDLRDMAGDGWTWDQLYHHLMTSGTANPRYQRRSA